jgi:hypothetical protein
MSVYRVQSGHGVSVQKVDAIQCAALLLVGARSRELRPTIAGKDTVADIWGSLGGAA